MERASSVFARLCLLILLPSTLVAGRLLSVEAVVAGIVVDMVGCDMVGCVVVGAGKSPISLFYVSNAIKLFWALRGCWLSDSVSPFTIHSMSYHSLLV